jgi:hypothetical protein
MRTKGPGEAALLLLDVVVFLRAEKIDYAVIGAMAASVHGVVRASVAADAILSLTAAELGSLERKFKAASFETDLRRGDPEDPISALLALTDRYGNRVDLSVGLRGLEAEAFLRAIDVPFVGEVLRVVGREDFIAMKLFAGGAARSHGRPQCDYGGAGLPRLAPVAKANWAVWACCFRVFGEISR